VADRRGAIPFALVGILAALALGAAVVGVITGPSADQIVLQLAAEQTAQAPSLSFTFEDQINSPEAGQPAFTVRGHGVWQSPDRWRVTDAHDGALSVTTGNGASFHVSGSQGPSLTFRLPPSTVDSFLDPNSPVLSLPPLGLLLSAMRVTRHGDVYSFDIPRLNDGATGWVAYAPLSHASLPLSFAAAFNTPAEVVIRHGYVVSLVLPRGIHSIHGEQVTLAEWHIADIGTASLEQVKTRP
jgi:hypothetical protein